MSFVRSETTRMYRMLSSFDPDDHWNHTDHDSCDECWSEEKARSVWSEDTEGMDDDEADAAWERISDKIARRTVLRGGAPVMLQANEDANKQWERLLNECKEKQQQLQANRKEQQRLQFQQQHTVVKAQVSSSSICKRKQLSLSSSSTSTLCNTDDNDEPMMKKAKVRRSAIMINRT